MYKDDDVYYTGSRRVSFPNALHSVARPDNIRKPLGVWLATREPTTGIWNFSETLVKVVMKRPVKEKSCRHLALFLLQDTQNNFHKILAFTQRTK